MVFFSSTSPRTKTPLKAVFTVAKVSAIMPATATLIVLALATLDDVTQIGSFLLAKVSK